jgi:hypothetical protein
LPQLAAQLGVEVRQRLVEQEHRGRAHERPADGDTLPLAARELLGPAVEVGIDPEGARGRRDLAADLGRRLPAQREREREVLVHRHVRVERVALEHHGDVASRVRGVGDVARPDVDAARARLLQPGNDPQGRGLAAPGRTDQDHELTARDREVQVGDRSAAAVAALVPLLDPDQSQVAHRGDAEASRLPGARGLIPKG